MQRTTVEEIFRALEDAWARNDIEGLVGLFAEDATLESALVARLFDRKEGVCRGRAEIRKLVRTLAERGRPWGGHRPPIVRGDTAVIEYTTKSSDTETFSIDVIELRDGKIQSLRAYTGWRALAALGDSSGRAM